jgi:hypothetical protein
MGASASGNSHERLAGITVVGQYILSDLSRVPNLFTDTESSPSYCSQVDGVRAASRIYMCVCVSVM